MEQCLMSTLYQHTRFQSLLVGSSAWRQTFRKWVFRNFILSFSLSFFSTSCLFFCFFFFIFSTFFSLFPPLTFFFSFPQHCDQTVRWKPDCPDLDILKTYWPKLKGKFGNNRSRNRPAAAAAAAETPLCVFCPAWLLNVCLAGGSKVFFSGAA